MFRNTTPVHTTEPLTLPPPPWRAPVDLYVSRVLDGQVRRDYGTVTAAGTGAIFDAAWAGLLTLAAVAETAQVIREGADRVAFLGAVEQLAHASQTVIGRNK